MVEVARKAVGYIRVSSSAQAESGESLGDQRAKIQMWASAMGCALVDVAEDAGESGKYFSRPGLLRVKTMAQAGKIDTLVATKMTRLGRSARELLEVFGFLEEAGCRIVLLHENIDTSTASGRLLRTMLAAISEFEWETIRDQTKAGKARRRAAGIPTNFGPSFGWDYVPGNGDGSGRSFTLNPTEADALRRVIALILDGQSLRKVAIGLNAEGVKSKHGRRWTSVALGSALSNPMLYGKLFDGRWQYIKTKRADGGKPMVKHKLLPESQWKFLMDVPALTDRPTWDRVQSLITDRRKTRNVAADDPFILRDLLYCGLCSHDVDGERVYSKISPSRGPKPGNRYYRCYWSSARHAAEDDHGRCSLPYVPASQAEDIAWQFARTVFLTPQVLIDQLAEPAVVRGRIKQLEADLAGHRRELAKLDKDEMKMTNRLAEGDVPPPVAKKFFEQREARRRQLTETMSTLDHQLADQQRVLTDHKAITAAAGGIGGLGEQVAEALDALNNDAKKQLLRAVLSGAKLVVAPFRPDHEHAGLWRATAVTLGVKGTGKVADSIWNVGGATVRPWRIKNDLGPGWTLVLAGRVNVGEVIERCGQFASEFRGQLGIVRSVETTRRSCRPNCHPQRD